MGQTERGRIIDVVMRRVCKAARLLYIGPLSRSIVRRSSALARGLHLMPRCRCCCCYPLPSYARARGDHITERRHKDATIADLSSRSDHGEFSYLVAGRGDNDEISADMAY